MPLTINRGKKAATVVNMADITGGPIRFAAKTEASAIGKLRFCLRYSVCSPITIASSTTMPSAMIRPKREIILIDWPEISITEKVARNATGIPAATQKATRADKKANSTPITINKPPRPFSTIKLMRSEIKIAATSCCTRRRFVGNSRCFSAMKSCTSWLTVKLSEVLPR